MSGTFMGINIALSSLQAQQAALDTVANNIANANTPGYKRQRVLLGEGNPVTGPFGDGINRRTMLGTGVDVIEIQRVQDTFVDNRVRQTSASASEWAAKSDTLAQLESIFNEPSDQGIGSQLDKFWSAWEKLSAQPDDIPTRKALIQQAQTLTMRIRQSYGQIRSIGEDVDTAVRDKVGQINSITSQIVELNRKIQWSSSSGASPNDLLDQRDILVGQLSSLAGVDVFGKGGQDFTVILGNKILVQGTARDTLGVRLDAGGLQEVYSTADGDARRVPGGEIAGLLDLRANAIPGFMTALDDFASALAVEVNAIHNTGFTMDGTQAGDFFDPNTTAADFEVDPDILSSARNVAASDAALPPGNNVISNQIAGLRTQTLAVGRTINQLYQGIISDAGTQSALAKQYADTQNATLEQFTAQQQSVSGVSLDEEMTDMIRFQQAYGAAARILTACDDVLSTLIEKTGMVGR